jgi:hypothetical protein
MWRLGSFFVLSTSSEKAIKELVVRNFTSNYCLLLSPKVTPVRIGMLIQVLCLEWDVHYWTGEDIIKCAVWGNYNAQRS